MDDSIEKIKINVFDIIFTDIMMPKMNGHELVDTIHSKNLTKAETKIALISGGINIDSKKCAATGVRVIYKPFSSKELRNCLLELEIQSKKAI